MAYFAADGLPGPEVAPSTIGALLEPVATSPTDHPHPKLARKNLIRNYSSPPLYKWRNEMAGATQRRR
jgi:hypothetical protein